MYCDPSGYNTLTEQQAAIAWQAIIGEALSGIFYIADEICPLCGWEDDGTKDVNSYRSIIRGSIEDYRKRLSTRNISNKWLKSDQ